MDGNELVEQNFLFWGEGTSDKQLFAIYRPIFENTCSVRKNRAFLHFFAMHRLSKGVIT